MSFLSKWFSRAKEIAKEPKWVPNYPDVYDLCEEHGGDTKRHKLKGFRVMLCTGCWQTFKSRLNMAILFDDDRDFVEFYTKEK
jgi:hypothetical protein